MELSELADYIIKNPEYVNNLDENGLMLVQQKLNPYSKVLNGKEKIALFSYLNPQLDTLNVFKTYSLFMFLKQIIAEFEEWKDDPKLKDLDKELLKKHLSIFADTFLVYDENRHAMNSSHTLQNDMPPLDFISKWERFEVQKKKELEDVVWRNVNYEKRYQSAVQIYDVFTDETKAKEFIDTNAKTIGIDILMAKTNKWCVLQDSSQTNIEFVGEDNAIVNDMIAQMKKDKQVGEGMIKKRMQTKKQ